MSRRKSINSRVVIWDVTSRCNLRCLHCYNADKYFNGEFTDLTFEQIIKLIDLCHKNNIKHIHLLGGEPLIHENILDIIKLIRSKNMTVSLTTNATLLNSDLANQLVMLVSTIFISIDGVRKKTFEFIRGKGTFEKTLNSISILRDVIKKRKTNCNIVISFTMTNYNINEIPLLPDFAKKLKIGQVNLSCLYESGNSCRKNYNLQYDIKNVLMKLEKMCIKLEHIKDPPRIALELRPRFAVYLNRRFYKQNSIKYVPEYSKCLAGGPLFYIEANGLVHPCHATNNKSGKVLQQERVIIYKDIRVDKYKGMFENNPYFLSFNNLKSSKYKEKLKTCHDCVLVGHCDPCPITFLGKKNVPECEFLKKQEVKYYLSLLSLTPVVRDNKFNYYKNITNLKNPVCKEIINLLTRKITIREIINELSKKYIAVSKENILQDVCEYLLDLRRIGLIRF